MTFFGSRQVHWYDTVLFTGRSQVEEEVRKYFTKAITAPVTFTEDDTGSEANSAFSWPDERSNVRLKYIKEEAYGL